ncbi:MAG: hypothetical protein AUG75_18010 [Cyanobacteria bacterium 13_1_20CM_4_61_6]|nr:MAG: hypothetical protein AUG75_18010 [Cyanobacteria bacterium 13_1_20CM_4_61_6]
MNRSPFCRGFLLILLVLACFALSPTARATCQEGCLSSNNTTLGEDALLDLTTGTDNTALGFNALLSDTTGTHNTAVGSSALYANQGSNNCAIGAAALGANTTNSGSNNTAVGMDALFLNSGSNNTAIGASAGDSIQAGNDNIFIGFTAGEMVQGGSHNIEIAHHGTPGDIATIRIGTKKNQKNTYIAGITGVTVAGGVGVIVDASGHLGTVTSSARFKDNVRPLVARDEQGKPYTVRYEAVNAMLLNEFLKEHRKAEEQQATITQLKRDFRGTVTQLTTRLDEQAAQIQKMSAQLEATKPAPQMVNNP